VSAQTGSGTDALDTAIREASTYLNGRVPKGSKAVFLNIKSDYPDLSEYILSVLSENAVNDGEFSVVDRQQLDSIRAELNFQTSGEVSDESAQSIGQMLGAQSIVSGAVSKIGSLYRIQVKAIEVQSAGVQGQWSRNIPAGPTIAALTERYAPATSGAAAGSASPARSAPPGGAESPAPKTYKIGDKGPGGGIVFYDKYSTAGGWRYLEAAPVETEQKNSWGDVTPNGTSPAIGDGKRNTQLIVEALRNKKIGGAAQYCDDLEYGGLTDWFLPSRDELNLMYQNLKEKGLDGFAGDYYWTSSLYSDAYPYYQRFNNGEQGYTSSRTNSYRVRAIRQF
jgi:hypothetical protein